MQMVNLMRDGKPVRMSKRTGKAITLTDLLDEVPIDTARFFFNLRDSRPRMDFDLDLAVRRRQREPGLLCAVRPRAHLLRAEKARERGREV